MVVVRRAEPSNPARGGGTGVVKLRRGAGTGRPSRQGMLGAPGGPGHTVPTPILRCRVGSVNASHARQHRRVSEGLLGPWKPNLPLTNIPHSQLQPESDPTPTVTAESPDSGRGAGARGHAVACPWRAGEVAMPATAPKSPPTPLRNVPKSPPKSVPRCCKSRLGRQKASVHPPPPLAVATFWSSPDNLSPFGLRRAPFAGVS